MIDHFNGIQARLQLRRAELIEELKARRSESAERHEAGPMGFDEEAASESLELERQTVLMQRARENLAEVEHALRKVEAGTYGRCDSCGRRIPLDRLDAIPQASRCQPCKAIFDKRRLHRPVAAI